MKRLGLKILFFPLFGFLWLNNLMLFEGAVFAQDGLTWRTDIKEVIEETKPGRLIVIAQFDCDFLKPVTESEELRNLERHTLDLAARKTIDETSVLVAQAVGFPTSCFELTYGKQYEQRVKKEGKPQKTTIGTSVIWICDSEGKAYDLIIGTPESKVLVERVNALSQFLKIKGEKAEPKEISEWQGRNVLESDKELYSTILKKLGRETKQDLPNQQSVRNAIVAADAARAFRLKERLGTNWNRELLLRFANLESQFYSHMLSDIPICEFDQLDHSVWENIIGHRLWRADQKELTGWVEAQRTAQLPILLRINDGALEQKKWARSSQGKLRKLVKQFAIHEATTADAAFVLNYFGSQPVVVSAQEEIRYLISTSRGDIRHVLTRQNENELRKDLEAVNRIEIQRK